MKGIDISSYQDNIDFTKVKKSGIQIVYIKATEGFTYNSPLMKIQYSKAKAAGLSIGFYHYLRGNNPVLEAKHFLGVIEGFPSDCKYAIDVEEALGQTKAKVSANVRAFADYLITNKKKVCIYTGDNFYANSLDSSVKNIPLWVAHYGVVKPYATNYIGFQYSNSGSVGGINGLVDLDEFTSDIYINASAAPVSVSSAVNLVIKTFQHVTAVVSITDKSGNKLIDDGIKGPRTDEVIAKVLIAKGAKNEFVRWIQQRLISLGFNCGKAGADADFGWNTLVAVQHFQASRRLKSDGVVGPLTITELLK